MKLSVLHMAQDKPALVRLVLVFITRQITKEIGMSMLNISS